MDDLIQEVVAAANHLQGLRLRAERTDNRQKWLETTSEAMEYSCRVLTRLSTDLQREEFSQVLGTDHELDNLKLLIENRHKFRRFLRVQKSLLASLDIREELLVSIINQIEIPPSVEDVTSVDIYAGIAELRDLTCGNQFPTPRISPEFQSMRGLLEAWGGIVFIIAAGYFGVNGILATPFVQASYALGSVLLTDGVNRIKSALKSG